MIEDLQSFKTIHDKLPGEMDNMMKTLQEMKNGSEPDKEADYWKEKKMIDKNIVSLKT